MEHTKEPWRVSGTGTIRYIDASVGGGIAQEVATCMRTEYGDMEANARRIVACVNACAGIPTEHLEVGPLALATLPIIKQRDQLLSTLQDISNSAKYLPACKSKDEILAAVSGVI